VTGRDAGGAGVVPAAFAAAAAAAVIEGVAPLKLMLRNNGTGFFRARRQIKMQVHGRALGRGGRNAVRPPSTPRRRRAAAGSVLTTRVVTFGALAGTRPKISVSYSAMISGRRCLNHMPALRTGWPFFRTSGSGSVYGGILYSS